MAVGVDEPELPVGINIHRTGHDMGGDVGHAASDAIASIMESSGRLLDDMRPDGIIVLGDRLDMIPAAIAALSLNIPIIHIHGGEVTLGAVDDRVRNAVSQFAQLHCVSTTTARNRLLNMGIAEQSIVVTGAPGIDTLLSVPVMSRHDFLNAVDPGGQLPKDGAFILATVHPETASSNPLLPMEVVLESLQSLKVPTLFTGTNSDPGGAEMRRMLSRWIPSRPWIAFKDTLGQHLYANALRSASLMVGNSSSGIIEAGVFGLPVVNVGERQKGRESGRNVSHVVNDASNVSSAIEQVLQTGRRITDMTYGSGAAGAAIAQAASRFLCQKQSGKDTAITC